ncbi:MAG: glucose-6-phosphate isomerase family protein [bacterium]
MMKPFAERRHEKMREVLMSPDSVGPEVHYYMIRGGTEKQNVTVWEVGTVGGEYIKAYGHYHVGDISETYKILKGEGILLLQKRKVGADGVPIDDEIETCYAVRATAGDSLFIPSGSGHLLLNTGSTWLTASDDSPVNFAEANPVSLPGHADYETVHKMKGFAYYVIEQNGKPAFVKNPTYKTVPEIIEMNAKEYAALNGS